MSKIHSVLGRQNKPAMESFDETGVEGGDVTVVTDDLPTREIVLEKIDQLDDGVYIPEINHDEVSNEPVTSTVEKYEAVGQVLEDSLQSGGVSMEAALLLNTFSAQLGVPVRARVSNESYGTQGIYESRVALESIKDVLRDWWNQLKNWLAGARKKLGDWLVHAFAGADALKSNAEALKETATNAQPASGDFEFSKRAQLLINGQFPNVAQEMTRFGAFAEAALIETLENSYENTQNIAGILGGFTLSGERSVNDLVLNLADGIAHRADAFGSFLTQKVDDSVTQVLLKGAEGLNVEVLASEPFLGNAQLAASIVSVSPSGNPIETLGLFAKAIKFSKIEILDLNNENKLWSKAGDSDENESKSVPRISSADVIKLAEGAIKVAEAMIKTKSISGKKNAADSNVDRAGNAVNNLGINEEVEGGASIASSLRTIVSQVATFPNGVTTKLLMWFGSTARTALQYGKESLAGEKEEKTETEAAQAENN